MKQLATFFLAAAACLGATAAPKTYQAADSAAIRFCGRTLANSDGSVTFDWSGVYAETILDGKALQLHLSEHGTNFYDVTIDGKHAGTFSVSATDTIVTIADKLPRGRHTIAVKKRTEGQEGKSTFHEFILPNGGTLTAANPRARLIEIIGDSYTAGYGTESFNRDDPFELRTENCGKSYSTIVPRYFNADYTIIAHSGRGALRNYGDSVRTSKEAMRHKMLRTFDSDTTTAWSFAVNKPDLVIINLGTNDFATEPHPYRQEFTEAYTGMLKTILDKYGNDQHIVCFVPFAVKSPMADYYIEAIKNAGGPNIHYLRMPTDYINNTTDLGSSWHPNYIGQQKMAMFLIPYISTIMDWPLSGKKVE